MKFIPESVTQKISRQILTIQKHSPRMLFVAGIVGVVGSTVLACRATLKLEDTLEEFKKDVDSTSKTKRYGGDISLRRDMARTYVKGTANIVKLYAPTVLIGAASIAALTGSHVALTRRNAALTAAYSAVAASYEAYRERVREQLGEEKELDIYHAIHTEKLKIDGKTEAFRMADPNKWSPYARMFDEYNKNWVKNSELNRLFVTCQQRYANDMLHARGHVFLNEVYDMLGFEHSKAGQLVGWVVGNGDNFVDFGVFEAGNSDFVNGFERSIILDFNVDGVVFDKI